MPSASLAYEPASPPAADPNSPSSPSSTSPPPSPYTAERQRIHALTLPPKPNFDIPASPPPPSDPSALAATTAKFTRFLALKRRKPPARNNQTSGAADAGRATEKEDAATAAVHFHARLRGSAALRNPSLLPTLLRFAGVREEEGEQYASVLTPEEGGVPVRWPAECYVEAPTRTSERRRRKKMKGRERVEFVPGAVEAADRREREGKGERAERE